MATLTLDGLERLLRERAGGVLRKGAHAPPNGKCEVCVRELRCLALGLPWSDHPDGPEASLTDRVCQLLNDAAWSSDEARTKECLPLALLSEATAPPGWVQRYIERIIREIIPIVLRAAANRAVGGHAKKLRAAASRCEREGAAAIKDAAAAAADADAYAAAAAYAAADVAADVAAAAAVAATNAAAAAAVRAVRAVRAAARAVTAASERDKVLTKAVAILIDCHKPAT